MSFDFLKKYRILLFIPILISLTEGNPNTGKNIVTALLLGYLMILANTYLVEFGLLEMNKVAYKRFTGGFHVIFAYLVLQKVVTEKKYKIFWGTLFLVISYDIFFTLQNRTGWLIFIALTMLFIFQHFSMKKQLIFYAVSFCLLIVVFNTSDMVQSRVDLTIQSLKNYDIEKKDSRTSIGLRLDWYQNSFELIKEKPIFGYGTGAYQAAQRKLLDKFSTRPTTEPHNEFLLTTVQIGFLGLAVFLALFIDPLLRSFRLIRLKKEAQAHALQATILFLFLGCLLNSWLLATVPSHIFFFLIVAFYPIRENEASDVIK
jgi:O-antigen ligase